MSAQELFNQCFRICPLIGIVRGVSPGEAEETARALYEGGLRIIEIPLNSPDPLTSIRTIAGALGDDALVGAGTVLTVDDVASVRQARGRLVVSPNMNPDVIKATIDLGMVSCPGTFTPTEAFAAIRAGATVVKLFPAEAASPKVLKAMRAVLPNDTTLIVVGGITPESMQGWIDAGANGFGLGGGLYKPGQSPQETLAKARAYVEALKR